MTSSAPPRTAAHPVAGTGTARRIAGRYRHDLQDGTWRWSPEMFTLHGLQPGTVEPSLDLLLRCQHPDDRARVVEAVTDACSRSRGFALETRVVRPDGPQRCVVLMGEPDLDPAGAVRAVEGMCLDVTAARVPGPDVERIGALETEVVQLHAAMASRAAIEQAKGVLMLLTTCNDQGAFDLLAHISSHTHRKVRDVARTITDSAAGRIRLPADVRAIIRDACPPTPG